MALYLCGIASLHGSSKEHWMAKLNTAGLCWVLLHQGTELTLALNPQKQSTKQAHVHVAAPMIFSTLRGREGGSAKQNAASRADPPRSTAEVWARARASAKNSHISRTSEAVQCVTVLPKILTASLATEHAIGRRAGIAETGTIRPFRAIVLINCGKQSYCGVEIHAYDHDDINKDSGSDETRDGLMWLWYKSTRCRELAPLFA
ncbi:hypothetical protein FKW77_003953 [Venturia effusa]|uniref:Uncharacterized protein n=1 Tax=Venturia effusa TaxID=50376 RepID=A0A517LAS9_9PEZI|nr:hypothetical protein FKW77_003953 [Venturia effusa]